MRGNFTLRASISPSNYINSLLLHHQNRSVQANSYQTDRHVQSHLTLALLLGGQGGMRNARIYQNDSLGWELNEQLEV